MKTAVAAEHPQPLPGDGAASTAAACGVRSRGSNRSSCYTTSSATMTAEEDSGDTAPEEDEDEQEDETVVRLGANREGGIWRGNINILE